MTKDNWKVILNEYLKMSGKTSDICRGIVATLSVVSLVRWQSINLAIVLFWTLEIVQYASLSEIANQTLKERISIKTANSLNQWTGLCFWSKIILTVLMLWSL